VEITIYFTDNKRLISGQLPYEVAVKRFVPTSKEIIHSVLDEFFKGPGDVERNRGLTLIRNGFTGYKKVEFRNGGVYVTLAGNCQSNGTLYNITRPLMLSLKQLPEVQFVKIYDQFGHTREPVARNNSIPACLDPSFTPSVTPLPTSTLSIRSTPTRTPRPAPVRPGR
jgi:Sporulation and spore germination